MRGSTVVKYGFDYDVNKLNYVIFLDKLATSLHSILIF
jgi:hypothetical protein